MNVIRDPYNQHRTGIVSIISNAASPNTNNRASGIASHLQHLHQDPTVGGRDSRSLPNANRLGSRSVSQDSVYTILIRLPPEGATGDECMPSIRMIHDDVPLTNAHSIAAPLARRPLPSRESEYSLPSGRRMSYAQEPRMPLNTKIIPKILKPQKNTKKKKKSQEKKQETKAAKTLSAILLSFIITWTPYNILVLVKPLTAFENIPKDVWNFVYALCYINSLINPMCYALCNASFRRTYVRILTCKWHTRNREAMTRGVYN